MKDDSGEYCRRAPTRRVIGTAAGTFSTVLWFYSSRGVHGVKLWGRSRDHKARVPDASLSPLCSELTCDAHCI